MRARERFSAWSAIVALALPSGACVSTGPASPPPLGVCDGFDFPVSAPNAEGYYDAQPFGDNQHLGNDWNGNGGGDTDRGDPVHSAAGGRVTFAADMGGGWGNVVRIVHPCKLGAIESLYAHLDTIAVSPGTLISRGQRLGTIGDAHGSYLPHLHFEIRSRPELPLGGGYGSDASGYLDPTAFILAHRP